MRGFFHVKIGHGGGHYSAGKRYGNRAVVSDVLDKHKTNIMQLNYKYERTGTIVMIPAPVFSYFLGYQCQD